MQKDFTKDFTSKDTAHICGPVGIVAFDTSYTHKEASPDLIVVVGAPPKRTDQELKQIVIDVLTTLVLPPVTADIIICSHSDDNTNPDMTCDYSLYKEIRPQTRTFHIPEVIEPDIIMIEDYEYNVTKRQKRQQHALKNRLNQQYKNNKIKHNNNIFYQYNIKHK